MEDEMRVSADRDDPDYVTFEQRTKIAVLLDGVVQCSSSNGRAVISADDVGGKIVFHEMVDGDKEYRPFKMAGEKCARFAAYGVVKIVRPVMDVPVTTTPPGDMWRVDVAGVACMVRGKGAKEHLERVNSTLARMKLALHKIVLIEDGDGCNIIALEVLENM
jgi:hypothetical protein